MDSRRGGLEIGTQQSGDGGNEKSDTPGLCLPFPEDRILTSEVLSGLSLVERPENGENSGVGQGNAWRCVRPEEGHADFVPKMRREHHDRR